MPAANQKGALVSTGPSLGFGAGLLVVAVAWGVGLQALSDNSFFTHLATGRLILETGSVPSTDPYTFTAGGEPWVVQSWLASWLYASVEALSGSGGLRVLMALTTAAFAATAWSLTRPAVALLPRLALGAVFLAVGAGLWAERPLMLGLIGLGLTALAVEDLLDPRWLVPVGWLWVNSHGSFPLGIAYVVVVLAGEWLDRSDTRTSRRTLLWLGAGVVTGVIGPLGPKVLLFPAQLLGNQDVLSHVTEWQAPTFDSFSQRAFLVQLVLVIIAVVRRPTYRSGLVVAVFTVAALLGTRNITVASLLFLPVLAAAAPTVGSLRSAARDRLGVALAGAAVVVLAVMTTVRLDEVDYRLARYPVDASAFLESADVDLVDHRMAAPDIAGNFRELLYGPTGDVFYDDRFDMFPVDVSEAHLAVFTASRTADEQLRDLDIDLVLWPESSATSRWFTSDPEWRKWYSDERWALFCRRGSDVGPSGC